MTAGVLTGSKHEIARQLANIDGEVREAIVFIEGPINAAAQPMRQTVEELFAEMAPYESHAPEIDDSREAIYTQSDASQ
jgi:hypothetical protein